MWKNGFRRLKCCCEFEHDFENDRDFYWESDLNKSYFLLSQEDFDANFIFIGVVELEICLNWWTLLISGQILIMLLFRVGIGRN